MKLQLILLLLLIGRTALAQSSTTIPVVQNRDKSYDWQKRHQEILALNIENPPLNVIMGNSIVHYWGGLPEAAIRRGQDSWNQYLVPFGLRNMGFGWDKIENVLWRVKNGELDGFTAKHVILMIGTNNLSDNKDDEVIAGLKLLVQTVKQHQPDTKIVLSGILPRRKLEERVASLNNGIKKLSRQLHISFINPGKLLLNEHKRIEESLFGDGLHPNAAGYRKIAPVLSASLGRK